MLSGEFDYNMEFSGITINTNKNRITFTDKEIQSFTITESVCSDNKISVGNVIASTLDLSLINLAYVEGEQTEIVDEETGETFIAQENTVDISNSFESKDFVGIRLEVIANFVNSDAAEISYPLGVFFVTSCTTTGMITRMQASNKFDTITYEYLYTTGLDWSKSHTIKEIVEDLTSEDNLRTAFAVEDIITSADETNGIDDIKCKKQPDKYTLRQMLSFCIAVFALNAKQSRSDENKIQFVKFDRNNINATLMPDITYYDSLTYEEQDSKLIQMVCSVKDDTTYYDNGMSSDEFLDVQLEADVEIFDFNASNYLWNIMSSEKYRAYNWQGVCDPRIECGDTVRIYIDETNYFDSFVFTNKIEYNGALTQTLTATTDSTIKTEAVRTGSVASTVVNNISTNESTTQQVTQSIVKQITSGSEEDSESLTTLSKGVVSNISADKESIATLQNAIGGFKVESVTELPATTDNNTIYLIQGEVNVT